MMDCARNNLWQAPNVIMYGPMNMNQARELLRWRPGIWLPCLLTSMPRAHNHPWYLSGSCIRCLNCLLIDFLFRLLAVWLPSPLAFVCSRSKAERCCCSESIPSKFSLHLSLCLVSSLVFKGFSWGFFFPMDYGCLLIVWKLRLQAADGVLMNLIYFKLLLL